MEIKLRKMIADLQKEVTAMGEVVEEAVDSAVLALVDRNEEIADKVIQDDYAIDEMELNIDYICHHILEDYSPTDKDSRYVTACLKISNDLERMGDLAKNISEYVQIIVKSRSVLNSKIDYSAILEQTSRMVRESVKAIIDKDTDLAEQIIREDDIVDEHCERIIEAIKSEMESSSKKVSAGLYLIFSAIALQAGIRLLNEYSV